MSLETAQGSPRYVSQPLTEEHDTSFLLNAILRSNKKPFLEKNSLCLLALPLISLSPSRSPQVFIGKASAEQL